MRLYYHCPLAFEEIVAKKKLHRLGLADSVKQHIHLILKTHFKECRYDLSYGCYVWEKDFETIRSVSKWKKELYEAFMQALQQHEKRVHYTDIRLDVDELRWADPDTRKMSRLRKRITIQIEGTLMKTNEPFQHTEYIFFSPLSLH